LLALYDEDGQTPAALCAAVGVEPGTMTKTLQRMERDALIERRPDPSDGRRTRIHLTAQARRLEPTLKAVVVDLNATVLEGLSPHQRGCFMAAQADRLRLRDVPNHARRAERHVSPDFDRHRIVRCLGAAGRRATWIKRPSDLPGGATTSLRRF
jgi:DNA-binding MarR family transcriptional regulator